MPRKAKDLVGKKFGKLTVLELIGKDKKSHRQYKCLCDCGKYKNVWSDKLTRKTGSIKSCGCLRSKFIDITNKKYGKLLVLKFNGFKNKNKCSTWECLCDCGKICIIYGSNLRTGNSTCCGCERILDVKRKIPGFSNRNSVLHSYARHCKEYNREWLLTNEEAYEIFQSNCYYCGTKPSQIRKTRKLALPYIYNGIDRIDNNLGYTKENCVPCCKYCNYAKRDRTIKDFFDWAKKLGENLSKLSLQEVENFHL